MSYKGSAPFVGSRQNCPRKYCLHEIESGRGQYFEHYCYSLQMLTRFMTGTWLVPQERNVGGIMVTALLRSILLEDDLLLKR